MPYARKRSFRSRIRYGRKPYGRKRRKTSTRYSVATRRKRSTKRVKRTITGPFAGPGNRMIASKKMGNIRWIDNTMKNISYSTGSYGKVYLGRPYSCGSCIYNEAKENTSSNSFSSMGMNSDMFSCKYQRGRVKEAKFTFEFSFPTTDGLYALGNQFIVGVYMSTKFIDPTITFLADFEDLKKIGNIKTYRVQSLDRPVKIVCDVNVPRNQDSPVFVNTQHQMYPKGSIFDQADTDDCFPNCDDVLLYPFVVPLSDSITSTWVLKYRASSVKSCEFTKPIQNILDTQNLRNYPALDSGLGATWTPTPMI